MTNVSTSSRRAFGLHIYVYFWLAFAGLGVACLFAVTFPIRDVEMPEFAFLALLTTPFLFWAVLSWSLWRAGSLACNRIYGGRNWRFFYADCDSGRHTRDALDRRDRSAQHPSRGTSVRVGAIPFHGFSVLSSPHVPMMAGALTNGSSDRGSRLR